MRSIMGRARAGYDDINSVSRQCIHRNAWIRKRSKKWIWMKTRAYVHSPNVVSARTLENADLKRVISAAVSIATLIWHDLEPNMQDKQFLLPMANLIICFYLVKFASMFDQKIGYIRSKWFTWTQWLQSVIINKINIRTQSTKSIWNRARITAFYHVLSE